MNHRLSSVKIKRIGEKDIDLAFQVLDLISQISNEPVNTNQEKLKKILKRTEFICLVALIDEEVVGVLTANVIISITQHDPRIFIYDLAVKEAFRKQNIARKLLENLTPVTSDLNINELYVYTYDDNETAQSFYRKLGAKEHKLAQFTIS